MPQSFDLVAFVTEHGPLTRAEIVALSHARPDLDFDDAIRYATETGALEFDREMRLALPAQRSVPTSVSPVKPADMPIDPEFPAMLKRINEALSATAWSPTELGAGRRVPMDGMSLGTHWALLAAYRAAGWEVSIEKDTYVFKLNGNGRYPGVGT